jgi:hypothetical protein
VPYEVREVASVDVDVASREHRLLRLVTGGRGVRDERRELAQLLDRRVDHVARRDAGIAIRRAERREPPALIREAAVSRQRPSAGGVNPTLASWKARSACATDASVASLQAKSGSG